MSQAKLLPHASRSTVNDGMRPPLTGGPAVSTSTSPARNPGSRGGGGGMLSSPQVMLESTFQTSLQLRHMIAREEEEEFAELSASFMYETKSVIREMREMRLAAADATRQQRDLLRATTQLMDELEPSSRSALRIRESKCFNALTHVLGLELAVQSCKEELVRVAAMEAYRRQFITSFEARELQELTKGATGGFWRQQLHAFGRCPFEHATDQCPFRHQNGVYGFDISPKHFDTDRTCMPSAESSVVVTPLSSSTSPSSSSVAASAKEQHHATPTTILHHRLVLAR